MFKVFDILRGFNVWGVFSKRHITQVTLAAIIIVVIVVGNPCFLKTTFFPRPKQMFSENTYLLFQQWERFSQYRVNSTEISHCYLVERNFNFSKLCYKLLSSLSSCVFAREIKTEQPPEKSSNDTQESSDNSTIQCVGSFLLYFMPGLFSV